MQEGKRNSKYIIKLVKSALTMVLTGGGRGCGGYEFLPVVFISVRTTNWPVGSPKEDVAE